MSLSGIVVNHDTTKQFHTLRGDSSVSHVKININDETFQIVSVGKSTDNPLAAAAAELEPKKPAYILVRTPKSQEKFYVVFYVPMNARVHDKMIYSSSLNSLKLGLGSDNLAGDFYINDAAECNEAELYKSVHTVSRADAMTFGERLALDSHIEVATNMATEAKVVADLPVQVHASVHSALAGFKDSTVNAILFKLNPDTEELEIDTKGTFDIDAISTQLGSEPRFILAHFTATDGATGATQAVNCFVYYCPEQAKIKTRMFYSATKSVVMKMLDNSGIPRQVNFEASEPADVTNEVVNDSVFPKKAERVVQSKPKPQARGAKSLGVSFSDF